MLPVFVLRLMKARRLVVCLIIVAALIPVALWHPSAIYVAGAQSAHTAAEHLLMGNPSAATTDINNPNNYLMEKTQYVLSYNRDRGTPNWVSWHLDSTWTTGVADRQNDYRADPAVPSAWYRVQANDYSGSGFDRGHITPSADRTSSIEDNSATFLMTNFIPQASDNNQGPWASLENYLRTLVDQGNEIYIISGPSGVGGQGANGGTTNTVANGHVTVPQKTWKVALVLPLGDNDVARVGASTRTIAVIMPNTQGIRNNSWQKYLATIDQVEALTGYDFFSNVPSNIQAVIESRLDPGNNATPVALSQAVTTPQNTAVSITLAATDANVNSSLSYTIVSGPLHGTLSGAAPNLTYTPAANYTGTDSFTFKANDSTADSNTATVTINVGATAPPAGSIQLSSNSYSIKEDVVVTSQGYASLLVDVTRTGDTTAPASVRYSTTDKSFDNECDQATGQASQRCDYTAVAGTLRFAANEASKTISVPVINDGYIEGSEVFTLELLSPVGAALGTNAKATITIADRGVATGPSENPYLSNEFFVRMNYLDFLAREPDAEGWNTWPTLLNGCGPERGFLGAPPGCDRAHVSHGFYASPEFTDTGFLIYRMYEVGMNRLPRYSEFIPDMATLSGFGISDDIRQQNLQDYLEQFTTKQEFVNRFHDALQPSEAEQLILKLEQTAVLTLPATAATQPGQPAQYGRAELIQKRVTGAFTVAQTLKAFVEQQPVYDKYFPRGAVTMQYFAYLKRDPDLNDPNLVGWNDWVEVFTNGGAARGRPDIPPRDIHHLIFGFIYSTEYRKRFGAP